MALAHAPARGVPQAALDNKLKRRGIAEQALTAGWRPRALDRRPGWAYPVSFPGGVAWRWKAADGEKPKNKWLGGKPKACKYYLPQGSEALTEAVDQTGGVLWIANGEPSLLAHLSAGMRNVVCWFGEGQPPHTLVDDLRAWGVSAVYYPADKDEAGRKGAVAVRGKLKDSGIAFRPLQWGTDIPEHGDANDAWIAASFDTQRFAAALSGLTPLLLPAEAPVLAKQAVSQSPRAASSSTLKRDEAIAEIIRQATARPGHHGRTRRNGDYVNFCCLLHDDSQASAGINTRTGVYTCFVCGSFPLADVCEKLGVDYAPRVERWTTHPRRSGAHVEGAPETPSNEPTGYQKSPPISPLTLWQAARYMCVCSEYALIHILTRHAGITGDFTAAQLAELAWVSPTTAQNWIDKTLRWRLISELTAFFESIEDTHTIPSKNAVNSRRGRKAVHYCLTPHLAEDMIRRALPDHVQELMEPPDPGVIYAEEAAAAGVGDADALEHVSAATASSLDGLEVTAQAERAADRKADELERLAEVDTTPFPTDELPCSVRELRTMLIETLIATEPGRVWKHAELMWVAGATKHNVGALIARSPKFMPAPQPTFVTATFDPRQNPHTAMRKACREHHGAPVAWLDSRGEVISGFGRVPPPGAKGGLINIGKVYVPRTQPPPAATPPDKQVEQPAPEPTEEARQKARRARARSVILPRLRGCLLARGWRHIPGPYGYWQREAHTADNTFEGMVEALLADRQWAIEQAQNAAIEEILT